MIRQALILSAVLLGGCDKPREVDPWSEPRKSQTTMEFTGWVCHSWVERGPTCEETPSRLAETPWPVLTAEGKARAAKGGWNCLNPMWQGKGKPCGENAMRWEYRDGRVVDAALWQDAGKGPRLLKPCLGRIENNRCIRRVEINGAMREVEL